ncbi:nineteen complex-related protein 2-domain-containing protein [Phycomyces nitens]|nr:nineteen complex-related protein 2-domain-containing protein [Phycomyces nitens]
MFKKGTRIKNIRRKIETSDDETQDEINIETQVKQTITKSLTEKKKKKEPKKSLGLSFEDEEEENAFQIKKSKASRRLATGRTLPGLDSADGSNEDNAPSASYTAELLESLRANTPSMPAGLKNSTMTDDEALLVEKFPNMMNAKIGSTGIPDANAIHAAKKKRELLRKGVHVVDQEDDFISLDSATENSRLIREEDDIGDDGTAEYEKYVGEDLTLNKTTAKKQAKERRDGVREMIEVAQEDDEDEDDLARWEKDMIKHGGVRSQYNQVEKDPFKTPLDYKPAQIPLETTLPSMADVMLKLDVTSSHLTHSLDEQNTQIKNAEKNLRNANASKEDLEKEIERSSKRYNYFQELMSYVNDLGEMLDAKFPELTKLEEEAHALFFTKYEVVTERRWEDDLDDLALFAILPHMEVEEEQVDEFGRVIEVKSSEASRQRRREERLGRIKKRDMEDEDAAMWTDDDMQEEWILQKEDRLETIRTQKIAELLSDVSDEFKPLRTVMDRFGAWKTEFYEDYQKAFGSLSLPGAFEFYVRCELVSWDPFEEAIDFDSMRWHSVLSDYGVIEGEDGHEDADVELLNKVVEKVLIKRLKGLLDTLNPASTREMRHAVQAFEQVSYYVEKKENAYQDLTSAVTSSLERQLIRYADFIERVSIKTDIDENAKLAKTRFFYRQCKYLKTLTLWRRYIPKDTLSVLGDMVMNRILAPLLRPRLDAHDNQLETHGLEMLARLQQ